MYFNINYVRVRCRGGVNIFIGISARYSCKYFRNFSLDIGHALCKNFQIKIIKIVFLKEKSTKYIEGHDESGIFPEKHIEHPFKQNEISPSHGIYINKPSCLGKFGFKLRI